MGDQESLIIIRRVVGESMSPTLSPGQIVIALRRRAPQPGEVLVVRHNNLEKIKRLAQTGRRGLFVLGDNLAHSTDSRAFGWLPHHRTYKVIWPRSAKRRMIGL